MTTAGDLAYPGEAGGALGKLDAVLAGCPELSALRGHVRDFAQMMLQRRGRHLQEWMAAVLADDLPDLHSFVTGLRRDPNAVAAGLPALPWPTAPGRSKATSTASQ